MRLLLSVAVLVPSLAAAQTLVSDTGELNVTSESSYVVANKGTEGTDLVVSGGRIFSIFGACTSSCGSGSGSYAGGMRIRSYDLTRSEWEDSVQVFNDTTTPSTNDYHDQPGLMLSGDDLIAFNPNDSASGPATTSCTNATGEGPPYVRVVPRVSWNESSTWTGTDTTCIAATVNLNTGSSCTDVGGSGVGSGSVIGDTDVQTATLPDGSAVAAFETSRFCSTGANGLHAAFYRRAANGTWSGPFVLVRSGQETASGSSCTSPTAANVFAKTQIRERNGVLYAVWQPRINVTPTEAPSGRHSFELFAAKSADGGATWTDLAGGNSWTPTGATSAAPLYNDSDYRIWSSADGDLDQYAPDSFDVDSVGRLAIAAKPYLSGGVIHCGHAIQNDTANVYGLTILRQTDSGWSKYVVDATNDWQSLVPILTFDADDRLWMVKPVTTWSPTSMAYRSSTDGGATWTGWTNLSSTDGNALGAWYDPHRRWLGLSYIDYGPDELYVRLLRMLDGEAYAPVLAP